MKKIIILLSSFFISTYAKDVLVNIDRNVREISNKTSCKAADWSSNKESSCKCCLIKLINSSEKNLLKGQEIIDSCIKDNLCTNEMVQDIEKDSVSPEQALQSLYNQTVIIKTIDKKDIEFDKNHQLTEKGAATLLEKAYKEGKLPNKAFKSADCLEVTKLSGGTNTLQLFTVKSNCVTPSSSFILKESKIKYPEARHLAAFYGIKEFDDIIWPNLGDNGLPTLMLPMAYITYDDHYLFLMPRAPGISLDKFMIQYFLNPTEQNKKEAEDAYYAVGRSLALLHQKFMPKGSFTLDKTVIHGDFHHQNIFYDKTTGRVFLIDNERMAATFKNTSPFIIDIIFLLLVSIEGTLVPSQIKNKLSKSEWLSIVTVPFLEGYLSTFPPQKRKEAANIIKTNIGNYILFKADIKEAELRYLYLRYQKTLEDQFKKYAERFK